MLLVIPELLAPSLAFAFAIQHKRSREAVSGTRCLLASTTYVKATGLLAASCGSRCRAAGFAGVRYGIPAFAVPLSRE